MNLVQRLKNYRKPSECKLMEAEYYQLYERLHGREWPSTHINKSRQTVQYVRNKYGRQTIVGGGILAIGLVSQVLDIKYDDLVSGALMSIGVMHTLRSYNIYADARYYQIQSEKSIEQIRQIDKRLKRVV